MAILRAYVTGKSFTLTQTNDIIYSNKHTSTHINNGKNFRT